MILKLLNDLFYFINQLKMIKKYIQLFIQFNQLILNDSTHYKVIYSV